MGRFFSAKDLSWEEASTPDRSVSERMGMVIEPGFRGVWSEGGRDVGATRNRGIRTLPNPGMSMTIDKAGLLARSNDGLVDHHASAAFPGVSEWHPGFDWI
jgi:hypothetical protein